MSEDRFRFPDFFTLRVKIKVIRSREWIRYVKEDLMKRIVRGTSKTDSLRSYIAGTNDRTDRGAKAGGT